MTKVLNVGEGFGGGVTMVKAEEGLANAHEAQASRLKVCARS
jgi:hypothetical protein